MRRNPLSDAMENTPAELTIIAKGARFEGASLTTEGDLRVDGEVEVDEIRIGHRIIVGPGGHVRADRLHTREGVVSGKVEGHLTVGSTLVIKDTGRVAGQLDASRLVVEEGGICEGTFNVGTGSKSVHSAMHRRVESAERSTPGGTEG